MLKRISSILFVSLFIGITSCETDFSLNGDYKPTPIVYGLLDHADSIHRIKITKAFLGDGDNLTYAKEADSSYFKNVFAQVIEINEEGDLTGRKWTLNDSIVSGKSTDGIFYGPDQKIYYFEEKNLNPAYNYRLEADIDEGQHNFSAETELINNFSVPSTITNSTFKIRFAKNTVNEDKDYLSWVINFAAGDETGKYEISYTFNWTEHYLDGSAPQSFSKKRYIISEDDPDQSARIGGLSFFEWLGTEIPDDIDNIDFREFDGLDLQIAVAHQDMARFKAVGEPITGIAQVQPIYTNVDGGFGLFSSRHIFTISKIPFDAPTAKELKSGKFTITKGFN